MSIVGLELVLIVLGRFIFTGEERDSLPMLRPALMMFGLLLSLPAALYLGLQPQQGSLATALDLVGVVGFGII